jgi:hypothetical protein
MELNGSLARSQELFYSQTPLIYVLPFLWDIKFHTHTKQLVKLQFLYILIMCLLQIQNMIKEVINFMIQKLSEVVDSYSPSQELPCCYGTLRFISSL